jgi:hypothetical protein
LSRGALNIFLFLFFGGAGIWPQGLILHTQCSYYLSHSASPFFVIDFFKIGSHKVFAWGRFQTAILLISASWVAKIIGVSNQYRAEPWIYLYGYIKTTWGPLEMSGSI